MIGNSYFLLVTEVPFLRVHGVLYLNTHVSNDSKMVKWCKRVVLVQAHCCVGVNEGTVIERKRYIQDISICRSFSTGIQLTIVSKVGECDNR